MRGFKQSGAKGGAKGIAGNQDVSIPYFLCCYRQITSDLHTQYKSHLLVYVRVNIMCVLYICACFGVLVFWCFGVFCIFCAPLSLSEGLAGTVVMPLVAVTEALAKVSQGNQPHTY